MTALLSLLFLLISLMIYSGKPGVHLNEPLHCTKCQEITEMYALIDGTSFKILAGLILKGD